MKAKTEFDAVELIKQIRIEVSIKNTDVVGLRLKLAKVFIRLAMRIAGVGHIEFIQ